MQQKAIVIRKHAKPQKLVFVAADGSYAIVLTPQDLVEAGTPIHPETGDGLEFWGASDNEVPAGQVSPEVVPEIQR